MAVVDSPEQQSRPRFAPGAAPAARLAWFGAWTMLERTIANWVITGVTSIGFGLTIVLVFDELGRFTGIDAPRRPLAPILLGLALVGLGIAALVAAGWQYRAVLRFLRRGDVAAIAGADRRPAQTVAYAVTIVTIFIGVFTFLVIAARAL